WRLAYATRHREPARCALSRLFFFSSRRRHTRWPRDWSSDVCSSDLTMQTFSLRKEDITRRWYVVDAAGQPLGRLASRVAQVLRGKHKPTFTPHLNGGD